MAPSGAVTKEERRGGRQPQRQAKSQVEDSEDEGPNQPAVLDRSPRNGAHFEEGGSHDCPPAGAWPERRRDLL